LWHASVPAKRATYDFGRDEYRRRAGVGAVGQVSTDVRLGGVAMTDAETALDGVINALNYCEEHERADLADELGRIYQDIADIEEEDHNE